MKNKKHSECIKKKWQEGVYKNRDESYRNDDEYRKRVSNTTKKKWVEGVFGKERNLKISKALKGRSPWNKNKKRDYEHICKVCKERFTTKTQHRAVCDKKVCQRKKGSLRKISSANETKRRRNISKAMKGKIPRNLFSNVTSKNSPPQRAVYACVKKYFPTAEYNYFLKTKKNTPFFRCGNSSS